MSETSILSEEDQRIIGRAKIGGGNVIHIGDKPISIVKRGLKAERWVIGMFESGGTTLKIISVNWLTTTFPKVPPKDKTYTFDFTQRMKDLLLKYKLLNINKYESNRIYYTNKEWCRIEDTWIEQQETTVKDANFKIVSKLVLPIFASDENENYYLWGVSFFESRESNLKRSQRNHIEFYRALTNILARRLIHESETKRKFMSEINVIKGQMKFKYEHHHLRLLSKIKNSERAKGLLNQLFVQPENRIKLNGNLNSPESITSLCNLFASRLVDLFNGDIILTTPGIEFCKQFLTQNNRETNGNTKQ